ncbi:Major facilitator superfamily domain general substrate transporter [Penicillium verhagenii]|uniref:Major facilitator superfamily domain general substrate transporter n=1 Tax=Penicillium verhagenii TaxID=1562060 RepID=UPI002544DA10|nr:Major facilitator superfamily domain general substrate transporter [Penicillium verhagenii]KAJ5928260.1 Major facilitator superfamily domain general substrate transporter [Penicillium verhagenii]
MALERNPSETSPLLVPGSRDATTGAIDIPHEERAELSEEDDDLAKEPFQDANNQLKYLVPAVSLGIFMSAADQTIIMASYGQIGSDLKALNLTSWIATSYFLTLTSFQPLFGKLSDIFGRKGCLLTAYVIFGMGNLGCGLARNINELIAARVIQGIGGGGMTTVVSILMSDLVPLRDRGLWQGILNLAYATGSSAGAPLGGILADYIGWRWAFLSQFPLCIMAIIAVSLVLKLPARENTHWKTKLKRVDFLGAVVLVGAVLGFLIGLDRGSNVSWTMPLTIISLSVSAFLFIVFILVERHLAVEPFAPSHIIFNRTFFSLYCCNFFSFGGWLAALFYIPLYFQAVDGVSATVAGVRLLPSIVSGATGSILAGLIMRWTGKYYWLTLAAYACLTSGCTLIYLSSGGIMTSTVCMIIGMVMSSFGNGIGVTTTLIGLISNSSVEDQAVVTACSYLFRSLGSVIGVSLSSSVVQQLLRERLRSDLHDSKNIDEIVNGVRESLNYIKRLDPDIAKIVRNCYAWSTNKGFGLLAIVVFFAFFSACFIHEAKLKR